MIIGVDLDGVVFNSEMFFMAQAEIYDAGILKRNSTIKPDEPRVQDKFAWSDDEIKGYVDRYSLSEDFDVMPCAGEVLSLLSRSGMQLYAISARGQFYKEELTVAHKKLKGANISFDKFFWGHLDKLDICLQNKIDFMIDDRYDVCEKLSRHGIVCFYYQMAGRRNIENNEMLYTVHNWGEIYRIFVEKGYTEV